MYFEVKLKKIKIMNDKFFSMDLRDPCSGCPFRQYQELQRNSQLLEDDKSKLSRTYPADLDKALAQSPMQVKKLTKHIVKTLKEDVFTNPDTATIVGCFLLDTLSGNTRTPKQYAEIKKEIATILFTENDRRRLDGIVPPDDVPSFSTTTLYILLGFLLAYGIIPDKRGLRIKIIKSLEPVAKNYSKSVLDNKRHAFSRLANREIGGKIVVKEQGYYFTRRMVEMIKAYCQLYIADK